MLQALWLIQQHCLNAPIGQDLSSKTYLYKNGVLQLIADVLADSPKESQ